MRESSIVPGTGPHPDLDRWIAYHGGELPETEEDQLRSHLASCRVCVSLVLDLESFNDPTCLDDTSADETSADDTCADDVGFSEFERAAAWRAMKTVLPARDSKPTEARRPWWSRRLPVPMTLAASFLVGALGISLWGVTEHRSVLRLREQAVVLSTPQLNMAILDLEPNMETRSGSSPSPKIIRQGQSSALVMLPSKPFDSFVVEVLGADGQVAWSGSGLVPDSKLGTLTLGIPPRSLPLGKYRIRLSGGDPETALDDNLSIEVLP